MNTSFDLAVIGAGPAGAAAALGAARAGLSVVLCEPQSAPDKPCGEGILPAGVTALRALGLDALLAQGLPLERIRYVLASGDELEIPFASAGCALERPVLIRALEHALAAEAGITRLPHRVQTTRVPQGFTLTSGTETWGARTLIAADGLQGSSADWLRRPRATPTRAGAQRFGLRARAELRAPLARVEVHLGRGSEVYLTPLPGNRINVAVLRDELPEGEHSSAAMLAAALREHPRVRPVLGAWVTPPEGRALSRARPRRVAEAGAFLAGDASGGVDPVLGCGVAIALTTGLAAAEAARQVSSTGSGAPERRYARFVRRETSLRRAVASGLAFLAAHPRAQQGFARLLAAWPAGGQRLAARIAGR